MFDITFEIGRWTILIKQNDKYLLHLLVSLSRFTADRFHLNERKQ